MKKFVLLFAAIPLMFGCSGFEAINGSTQLSVQDAFDSMLGLNKSDKNRPRPLTALSIDAGSSQTGFLVSGNIAGYGLSFEVPNQGDQVEVLLLDANTGEFIISTSSDSSGRDSFSYQVSRGDRSIVVAVNVTINEVGTTPNPTPSPGPIPDPDPTPEPDPDPTPNPEPPGDMAFNKIALAGCSQTRDWVGDGSNAVGYEELTGQDLFTNAATFGGGSVDRWIENNSAYLSAYRNSVQGTEDAILAQVCIRQARPVSFDELSEMIDLIKSEVPGKPLYLMPLDVSEESSGCTLGDYESSVNLVNQAVNAGLAEMGPAINPLYNENETVADKCHPNDAGAARMTDLVQDFFGASSSQ